MHLPQGKGDSEEMVPTSNSSATLDRRIMPYKPAKVGTKRHQCALSPSLSFEASGCFLHKERVPITLLRMCTALRWLRRVVRGNMTMGQPSAGLFQTPR